MKNVVILLFALILLPVFAEAMADEETYRFENFEYALMEDGSAELIRYWGQAPSVVIPNELDGHPVMAVRQNPFALADAEGNLSFAYDRTIIVALDHPYLATIDGVLFGTTDKKLICYPPSRPDAEYTIPYGITSIGKGAFASCANLERIIIPDTVTSIGGSAFYYCPNLTDLVIPESVTSVGDFAFSKCNRLRSITLPYGITEIGKYMFFECRNLEGISIPDSVTAIGTYAFYGCGSLTDVSIPDSVTRIDQRAFQDCSKLAAVTISKNLNIIDECVFSGCALTKVVIPESVTVIGYLAFASCPFLVDLTIPDSVTLINFDAFRSHSKDLVVSVTADSYAQTFCREQSIQYVVIGTAYGDRNDWLQ